MRRLVAALAVFALGLPASAADTSPTPTPPAALGDPITLDVKDADLRDVLLRRFAPRTRLNVVLDPDVKGSVTVRLENVPFERALEIVLASNGCGWTVEGRILRIGLPEKL